MSRLSKTYLQFCNAFAQAIIQAELALFPRQALYSLPDKISSLKKGFWDPDSLEKLLLWGSHTACNTLNYLMGLSLKFKRPPFSSHWRTAPYLGARSSQSGAKCGESPYLHAFGLAAYSQPPLVLPQAPGSPGSGEEAASPARRQAPRPARATTSIPSPGGSRCRSPRHRAQPGARCTEPGFHGSAAGDPRCFARGRCNPKSLLRN